MPSVLRVTSKTVLAPAKINVTLEVLGRRSDGYHRLRSVMVPVGLYDRIAIEPHEGPLQFTCSQPRIEAGNLVQQACERLGLNERPFRVHLEKAIPIGAGLGGGSSDAAAILLAAQAGAFGEVPHADWLETARSLGSDVPVFLVQTAALVEGTGERVTPLGALPRWWATIVHPDVFVSTKEAYALLDAHAREESHTPRTASRSFAAAEALQRADFTTLVETMSNDFEPVITHAFPPITDALAALRVAGAPCALLSGSGSAVFAIAEREDDARTLCDRLPEKLRERAYVAPFLTAAPWRSADG